MTFFLMYFALAGHHWEAYATMHTWYLRRESDHAEIAVCFVDPKKPGMQGKLTNTSDNPTVYDDLTACQADLETKVPKQ